MSSLHTDMCIYTHVLHSIQTLVELRNKKTGTAVNAACQGNLYMSDFLDTRTKFDVILSAYRR